MTAKHEASHASACLFLGCVPDSISIAPAPSTGGYTTGVCSWTGKPSVSMVATAVGVLAGHGNQADLASLAEMVPDECERERVLDVARRLMEHRQFKVVRKALWRRLQHLECCFATT
jgi:hypothetical protein